MFQRVRSIIFVGLVTVSVTCGCYFLGGLLWNSAPASGEPLPVTVVPTAVTPVVMASTPVVTATLVANAPIRVQFPKGSYGTNVSGKLNGAESFSYTLWAAQGQTMKVHLSTKATAWSSAYVAGSGEFLYDRLAANTPMEGKLPRSGDYTVVVYGGPGEFQLAFEIR